MITEMASWPAEYRVGGIGYMTIGPDDVVTTKYETRQLILCNCLYSRLLPMIHA